MKTIIVGQGEIGSALGEVLESYNPKFWDIDPALCSEFEDEEEFDIMHICFGWSEEFEKDVQLLRDRFQPKYVVVHSTVPVWTCRKLGAISSPVRGKHPDLYGGIKTFVKFLGGENASAVADYFRRAGIKVCLFDSQEAAEAAKLFDTEYYRVCIAFAQRVKAYCDDNDLNFSEVYRLPNLTYNDGYRALGYPEYVRPVLEPIMGKIGGHCVVPNSELIAKSEHAPE